MYTDLIILLFRYKRTAYSKIAPNTKIMQPTNQTSRALRSDDRGERWLKVESDLVPDED